MKAVCAGIKFGMIVGLFGGVNLGFAQDPSIIESESTRWYFNQEKETVFLSSKVFRSKRDEFGRLVKDELDYIVNAEVDLDVPSPNHNDQTVKFSLQGKELRIELAHQTSLTGYRHQLIVLENVSEYEDWVAEKEYFIKKEIKVHHLDGSRFVPKVKVHEFEDKKNLKIEVAVDPFPKAATKFEVKNIRGHVVVNQQGPRRWKPSGGNWFRTREGLQRDIYDQKFGLDRFRTSQNQYVLPLKELSNERYRVLRSKKAKVTVEVKYDIQKVFDAFEAQNPDFRFLNRDIKEASATLVKTFN